jgi:branched-chain amino acid transport system permease protein
VLAVIVFVLVAIAVIQIRDGTVGRTLRAIRGSEVAAEAIGISPARARVTAFAVSAFIAGLGGALLSIQQRNVNYGSNFSPFAALFWLVLVVSLGARTVEGAAQAGASFALFDMLILRGGLLGWILRGSRRVPGIFPISAKWRFVLFGLGTIQFARHPEGLVEYSKRRAFKRAEQFAKRRETPAPDLTSEPEAPIIAVEETVR